MKVEFINPFLKSVLNVLSTMAQINATASKPHLKTDNEAKGDVTGIIGMAGENVKGSLAISFTESCILKIASNMLGEEITEMSNDTSDVVGEITNMVSGGAKAELSQSGYKFDMAIPTTITGKNHTINHNSKGPLIVIPFSTEDGNFFIEVCFEDI